MKKLAAIFVFAFVTPAVFAAPGQVLMAHDGPGAAGVTRSDRGYDHSNGPAMRDYPERRSAAGRTARESSNTGGAAPDRAAVAATRNSAVRAPGPLPVKPVPDEAITLEFPRDLGTSKKPEKSSRSALTEAEKEQLRADAENQRWLENEARAAKILEKKHTPDEFGKALKAFGNNDSIDSPLSESDIQKLGGRRPAPNEPIRIF